MATSGYRDAVNGVQGAIRSFLKDRGFSVRGRTFNRKTGDGLTQAINFQMGASDPPGTTPIPGLRENLHGLFTVNLGIYVPEVARVHGGGEAKSWVQDYHCCVRTRLGETAGKAGDFWWAARMDEVVVDDVRRCLQQGGLPFLDRFESRDRILAEWEGREEKVVVAGAPRIVMAVILAERGEKDRAKVLLARQARETRNPGHPAYVRRLAATLGLGSLDG